jgi:tight adherence protein C
MTSAAAGALVGLAFGGGVALAVARAPIFRRPTLIDRLAPYLRDSPIPSRLLARDRTVTPFPTLERVLRPVLSQLSQGVGIVERLLGGGASVRRRLDQAGREITQEQFRAEQVVWGAAALLAALVLSVVLLANGATDQPVALLILCAIAAISGVLVRDRALTREVRERERRMLAEFPTIAELLALSVAAGEGAVGALERVTTLSSGELARELGRALADARAGASLVEALERMADRTNLVVLVRFVDGVAIAVERGTPLADVLRAQASDVREAAKRALLEAGGRKEIAMMVPVVFLILPVTVVFALYPGFFALSLSTP